MVLMVVKAPEKVSSGLVPLSGALRERLVTQGRHRANARLWRLLAQAPSAEQPEGRTGPRVV